MWVTGFLSFCLNIFWVVSRAWTIIKNLNFTIKNSQVCLCGTFFLYYYEFGQHLRKLCKFAQSWNYYVWGKMMRKRTIIYPSFTFFGNDTVAITIVSRPEDSQAWVETIVIPACKYMFKVNNKNTRTRCEIYSKLTVKTPLASLWCHYC